MKTINKKERERMAEVIYNDIEDRLQELANQSEEGKLNEAYIFAFQVGLRADIEDSLKKCKLETT